MIDYNNKQFRSVQNSSSGDVTSETVFHYRQTSEIVTGHYSGGEIVSGHLIAVCDRDDRLDMRYHHVNSKGELMTGICVSVPEILDDGRIRMHEKWQWTCSGSETGESIVEEF